MASTCRRHLDGSIDNSEPSNRSMEKRPVVESRTQLSFGAYASLPCANALTGLMAYLQTPREAGPSIVQVTSGLQNWKCAGRRLVEIGGRLPTAAQLHQDTLKAFGCLQILELGEHASSMAKHSHKVECPLS